MIKFKKRKNSSLSNVIAIKLPYNYAYNNLDDL